MQFYSKLLIYPVFFFFSSVCAQIKSYSDGHGGKIDLPLGDLSFADEVVEFKRGIPKAIEAACDSLETIGKPDFSGIAENFLSLGCGGSLTLRFSDNALIDVPGADLFVFEVGKYIETTTLEISTNGKSWINVGEISGGTTSVDIEKFTKKGDVFHYVKLTDLRTDCSGNWPGADIDAVAAIGSGQQIELKSSLLYDVNEYVLLNEAKQELESIVEQINKLRPSKIVIEGHTDNSGNDASNQLLSERRAKAVADFLIQKNNALKNKLSITGYGSAMPIVSNSTSEGKEKNRRVSIIFIP